jgi:hypothetical protein
VKGASKDAPYITKPVSMDVLMSAMEDLLRDLPEFPSGSKARKPKRLDAVSTK